ncbi:MAG: bifunctional pyr operon transcriptional regulator/uracil phosphoribosyltransferase PyrR [Erysipelotrichaceae bacterium]|nr:bifunctional pyr operon transcriptional regulator/uracil phosphoribosyltransferase PyrR [Erysipelotrichaceae bacterium]MDY5727115.1 bifunctional pyr operon transcriptional regulator/uracil phosphoribosyltransferase PyrR [Erysipelotrichaceae bacterium]
MKFKARIMSSEDIDRALIRLSHQIIEKNNGVNNLCLIGIKTRGVPLAERIAANIKRIENVAVEVGQLDITLYRDDLSKVNSDPIVNSTNIPFSIEKKIVVLVDDVIFTGRTARAALDALMSLGRPAKIQLCELIDRGHSELPIKANYVGKNIPTSLSEVVMVQLAEIDGVSSVVINEK